MCVVVWAIWTVDIGLSSSVVELLTRAVGVPGSIPVQGYVFNVLYAHSYFPITFSVVGKKEWAYKTLKTYGWTGNWTRNPCNSCQEIYHCATQADIHGTYSPIYYTCLKTCTSSKTLGIFFIHSVSHFGNVVDWKPLARKNELYQ